MDTVFTANAGSNGPSPNEPHSWAPPAPTPPGRRRWPRIAATSVALAAVVGGGAGYVGATLASDGSTTQSAAEATPLAYTGTLLDVGSVIDKIEPSVVTIKTEITVDQGRRSYRGEAAGTGIVLTADGEILTNAHVVADATSITVTLDGETTARTAVLIGADTTNDIAVIKIVGASGLTPASIGDSDSVAVGDDVVAIGNALDLEGGVTVTRGIISALDRSIDVENGQLSGLIQTDAAISSGNSGGPLVNAAGDIIGMNSAGAASSDSVTAENIGFAIAINHAMAIVAQLRAAA
jgi:S1-C subfamily serine protease